MPDDRTFVTELATATRDARRVPSVEEAVKIATSRAAAITNDHWDRLEDLTSSGASERPNAQAAFENGRAFLESPDALRGRRPILIEWTGGRRPPGDEVAPIDLRVDHVFLVSCKYLSANIANPSPARLFDGLLATTGDWVRGDWYLETAPEELRRLYWRARRHRGEPDLPDDPVLLQPAERRDSAACTSRPIAARRGAARRTLTLCRAVSDASAKRWNEAIDRFGNPEQVALAVACGSGARLTTCSGRTARRRCGCGSLARGTGARSSGS